MKRRDTLLMAGVALALVAAFPAAASDRAAYAAFDQAIVATKAAMMGDPQAALAKADAALAQAQALPHTVQGQIDIATAEWLKGEALIGMNRTQDAAPVIESALVRAQRYAANSKLHGDLLRSRGALDAISGHIQDALRDFQQAYAQFHAVHEVRGQALALQDIGQIYWDAQDYPRVLQYYSQASDLYKADPAFSLTSHNNVGEVLRKLGRFSDAEKQYEQALASARTLHSPLLEVRVLTNLAEAQVDGGKLAKAERTIDRAIALTAGGEAAGWKPFVLGVAAKIALAQDDLARAGQLYKQTFAGMDLAKTDMPFKDFHERAAFAFEKLGQKDLALAHYKAFHRLDSSARNLTASTSSQLMASRFDFANQNLKIAKLRQGQLQRDIRIERQQSQFRTIALTSLIVVGGIILAILAVAALRIRRSRNQVHAANVVLNETNAALEKALKAKTEFLAMTSHEIRTPLNGILGMTQILLSNRQIHGEVRGQVEVLQGAGEAMKTLVDDILDVAKMETGEVTIVREETRVRAMLEDAVGLWGGQATTKGLTLRSDIQQAPEQVRSDPMRLRQVVFNLLSNAIKFTTEGWVALAARVESGPAGETMIITVADSGIGIPEDQQDRIFEAFHQVDAGTTRQFGGTGLGLAICRNLVEALGGTLTVESAPGQGSTFTLRMPIERLVENQTMVAAAPAPTALSHARVLLIEQNAMTQGLMRAVLEPHVATLEVADDGGAALDAVRRRAADHLLIEAGSAAISGGAPLAGLAEIIDLAREATIPVTVLLAPSEGLDIAEVAALGPDGLVLKPCGAGQLLTALRSAYAPRDAAAA